MKIKKPKKVKAKNDICPIHNTKRSHGFCFQCSEDNSRGAEI